MRAVEGGSVGHVQYLVEKIEMSVAKRMPSYGIKDVFIGNAEFSSCYVGRGEGV